METTQHIKVGNDGNNKCNDSAVAQQLTAANAQNANSVKILNNGLPFMISNKALPIPLVKYI